MQLRARQTGFVRTEGGLLPADLLERVRALDRKLPGLDEASYELAKGERFGEVTARSWNRLVGAWTTFQDSLAQLAPSDPATTATRERFLLPLMDELGYGRLSPTKAIEFDGKSYPVSHGWQDVVPLHLVGAHVSIDRRTQRVAGASNQSPHGLLQELLNRSPDRLWGIVSNGLVLRILRDNASLTRQAYVEFDLEAIFSGESYADFALLWHLAHRTRLEPRRADGADEGTSPTVHGCYLERWTKVAEETGSRARDRLRDGVQEAIEALGSGFLRHSANADLKTQLQSGELTTQDYYRELLRLVYRLILLFVAEDRDLLLDPKADPATRDRYTAYYSTARLRRLAERRKGSRHTDLYAGLRVVIDALGRDDGAPGIGLPPLGGFLFGPDACPHLDIAELANADLLDAIRKLATIEERGVLRSVDYRNLASEELGSIYESLLERHPEVDIPSASFALKVAAGHERKTTGSYYTPSSLISVLLDSALDPVLAEAADKPTKEEAERAILELSVVDPAAGSGHFLVAAAHRIAKRLAQVRTDDEEPAPTAITTALRDVIGHCLYAVDINPMAVELCKVSLWLEALEPGKPLTFLDAHIKCGNSLLGTTPELIAKGIPDAAYDPIEGDDKEVARAQRNRNGAERGGQQSLVDAGFELPTGSLATAAQGVDDLRDDDPGTLRQKAESHHALLASTDFIRSRLAADAWCAAFVVPKSHQESEITTATVRRLAVDPQGTSPSTRELIGAQVDEYGLFHWPLEFPQVFERGGFDVVVGNPPWERVKLQEKEFFAERSPSIAGARNAADRKRMIAALERDDPTLWNAFRSALRHAEGESHLLRNSSRYPLAGRGDINTYAVFAELTRSVVGPRGRVGVILPTGIATDESTKTFFGDLVSQRSLASLYSFENEEFVFPAIHHATKFCLLTVTGSERPVEAADLVFFARQTVDLVSTDRHFSLTEAQFELLSPNTRTCPTFRSRQDASIALALYERVPVLIRQGVQIGNPWRITFSNVMFHMANDAGKFLDAAGPGLLPLYEAKMFHQFDHRFGSYEGQTDAQKNQGILPRSSDAQKRDPEYAPLSRYWVRSEDVDARLLDRWEAGWLLAWRNITSSVTFRTVISAVIPRSGLANSGTVCFPTHPRGALLVANLNSLVLDWAARQRIGGVNLSLYMVEQLPLLPPDAYGTAAPWMSVELSAWLRPYVAELVYTSSDLAPFARDLGWSGPPFIWDDARRRQLRAEIDATFFLLYGMSRLEVAHILESFWVVREADEREHGSYRTKELILEAFDAMAAATPERPFTSRLVPDPGDPAVAHPPKSGEGQGRWIPWADVERSAEIGSAPTRERRSDGHRSRPASAPLFPARSAKPEGAYPEIAPPYRRAADSTAAARDSGPRPSQGTLTNLSRAAAASADWLPEEAVEDSSIVPGRRVRHPRFGEGLIIAVRRTTKSPTVTIRFGVSDDHEIAIGYGLVEFESE